MISALEIKNYKCFQNLNLEFGALTFLTGYNGGGKSSSTQPLLLLAQAFETTDEPLDVYLNGNFVNLGTAGDILRANNSATEVYFKVTNSSQIIEFSLKARAGDRMLSIEVKAEQELVDSSASKADPINSLTLIDTLKTLSYLSAIRPGTPDNYPLPESGLCSGDVGVDGCFSPYWYAMLADEEVPPKRCHPSESANTFRKQLDAWLGVLFPEAQANVVLFPQLSLLNLQFRLTGVSDWRRPANLGYGFSYAFPILVSLLSASEGQLIIIDSPEAHLHPSAQSQMGRILAIFAASGVQIIVETHSDHLLNGTRVAVKEKHLLADELRIYFFKGSGENGHGVHSPSIDQNGSISDWPNGFFDQSEKDLSNLAGW
jgi:predicted ATPase